MRDLAAYYDKSLGTTLAALAFTDLRMRVPNHLHVSREIGHQISHLVVKKVNEEVLMHQVVRNKPFPKVNQYDRPSTSKSNTQHLVNPPKHSKPVPPMPPAMPVKNNNPNDNTPIKYGELKGAMTIDHILGQSSTKETLKKAELAL